MFNNQHNINSNDSESNTALMKAGSKDNHLNGIQKINESSKAVLEDLISMIKDKPYIIKRGEYMPLQISCVEFTGFESAWSISQLFNGLKDPEVIFTRAGEDFYPILFLSQPANIKIDLCGMSYSNDAKIQVREFAESWLMFLKYELERCSQMNL